MKTSKKGKTVKMSIPWTLHMAIIRLQGTEELEYHEACVRAALLIEEGGEKFKEAVKVEANRIHKSRFMGEINKAKNTWYQKGYNDGLSEGTAAGSKISEKTYQIRYPCSTCGGDLILRPENKDTKAAIKFLQSQGWSHTKCIETLKP